jgi:hypothetical protein
LKRKTVKVSMQNAIPWEKKAFKFSAASLTATKQWQRQRTMKRWRGTPIVLAQPGNPLFALSWRRWLPQNAPFYFLFQFFFLIRCLTPF